MPHLFLNSYMAGPRPIPFSPRMILPLFLPLSPRNAILDDCHPCPLGQLEDNICWRWPRTLWLQVGLYREMQQWLYAARTNKLSQCYSV